MVGHDHAHQHGSRTAQGPGPQEERAHAGGHREHHAMMVADYRRRFWVSLALTLPVLGLAPLVQGLLGLGEALRFPGEGYVRFVLASAIFAYGGWPFLKGLVEELARKRPGMMTLIGLAISAAPSTGNPP